MSSTPLNNRNQVRRYRWPWAVLAAFLLAVILAVVAMRREALRLQHAKEDEARMSMVADLSLLDTNSSTEGMVWIPSGAFVMGSETGQADEKPVHQVELPGFWMDKTEVTNEEFARFVKATGYVTWAERTPSAKDFPDVPPDKLV